MLEGLGAAHDAAGAVWGGEVPVGIALAGAYQGAVPHVHGDDALLSLAGGDGALADDIVVADVVVHALEAFGEHDFRCGGDIALSP